jgi:hypothetical protein
MTSPYWKYPHALTGRIKPSQAVAQDGSWVFCLGEDQSVIQSHRLAIGDTISIEQSWDMTGVDLVRFRWKTDVGDLPVTKTVVSSGPVSFKVSNMFGASDGACGVDIGTAGFLSTDAEKYLRASGTTNNNTDFRISGIPATQDGYTISPAGRIALFDAPPTAEDAAAATLKVLGLRWTAKILVNEAEVLTFYEEPNIDGPWRQLAAHVSKLTGSQAIKFLLELEQYE